MILVPLFDLKFLTEFAAGELQIGGTSAVHTLILCIGIHLLRAFSE